MACNTSPFSITGPFHCFHFSLSASAMGISLGFCQIALPCTLSTFSLPHLALWVACHIYTHYPFPLCSNTTRFRKFPNCLIKLIYFAEFLEFLHFFTIFLPPLFPISIVFNFFYIRFPSTVFTFFYFLLSLIIFCIISSASIIPIYFLQSFPIFFSALLHDDLVLPLKNQSLIHSFRKIFIYLYRIFYQDKYTSVIKLTVNGRPEFTSIIN